MTNCPYCGASDAYDTGFHVECSDVRCEHFSQRQLIEVCAQAEAERDAKYPPPAAGLLIERVPVQGPPPANAVWDGEPRQLDAAGKCKQACRVGANGACDICGKGTEPAFLEALRKPKRDEPLSRTLPCGCSVRFELTQCKNPAHFDPEWTVYRRRLAGIQ